jgi:PAS domain S-box-containing protein
MPASAQDQAIPSKKLLILYSFDNDQEIYSGFDHVLRTQLRMRVSGRVEFYTEYLDLVRFPSQEHAQDMVKLLALKYSQRKPDLIIPVSFGAIQFLLNDGKDLFPGIPMVALFNQRRLEDLKTYLARNPAVSMTGVSSADDPAGTVDLALKLQPDTEHIAVVVGSSYLEKYWLDQLHQDLEPFAEKVDLRFLADLPINELLSRVAQLPPHTIILSTFFFQDQTGQFLRPEEVSDLMAQTAHAPIYGIYSNYIGHGVVGGRMTDSAITGRKAADLAIAVLNGQSAGSIPFVKDDSLQDMVDGRQLHRWDISESRLPPGVVELYREPSAWERYRTLILLVTSVGILQTFLIFALILNIRRRRNAEKGLLREKSLADAVIEGLPGIFVLQDEAGKNLRWNRNMDSISRYNPSDVHSLGNVAEHDRERVGQARERVFRNGTAHTEADMLVGGGKTTTFYITGVRVELEGKPHVAAIGLDVTERKLAEEALRRSEAAIRSLVENAPYGIATISVRQDCFVHANPAMVKLLGYKSEAELQALQLSRDVYTDSDGNSFRAQPTRADFFNSIEFKWKRRDGKDVIVRASGRRIAQETALGDLIEIIAEDVTARHSLEEQLRHSQKMEALGQLSGSVAHDFNNLLSVIIGYSEILSANPVVQDHGKAHLETIKKAAERAVSLTAQLLAFSRRQVMQPSVVHLNAVVRETEKMLRRLMRENVAHKVILDPELWKTRADPGQMVQVIMNLAINARDAMPKGGELTVMTRNVTFTDFTHFGEADVPPGQYVLLSVSDTGIGMNEATRARVFEPFFTTKAIGKGTGLGLATVYGIIKQSGGYIFVESVVGKGSTFTIYLPALDQSAGCVSETVDEAPAHINVNNSETLLVVEDEHSFRELLRDGLQSKGYKVLVAANGIEALRVAEQFEGEIRVLVTDVIMPHMSGPELASALKSVRPNTAVLYMSGYTDDKTSDEPASEVTLMQKPFYIDDIARKIREVLAERVSPLRNPDRLP